jgi:hypothetical protein
MTFLQLLAKYPDHDRVAWHRVPGAELRADLSIARDFRELRANTPESGVGGVIEGWIARRSGLVRKPLN